MDIESCAIEEEQLYLDTYEEEITEPFNPKDVDIITQPMVIANIVDQLKYGDIILEPDFQRRPDLWKPTQQSRLIESLMVRIPLPSFYFDSADDDKLIVVPDNKNFTDSEIRLLTNFQEMYYESVIIR